MSTFARTTGMPVPIWLVAVVVGGGVMYTVVAVLRGKRGPKQ